jgi:hypothetical protein
MAFAASFILKGHGQPGDRALDQAAGQPPQAALTLRPASAVVSGSLAAASWAIEARSVAAGDARAGDDVVAVDTNDGFLAVRRLDSHGNPTGAPYKIAFDCTGTSARRDAQVRHAITRLIRYADRYGITTIAIEDLNFEDARQQGRETMGRGQHGKRFRRTVAGIPTAAIRGRLTAMASRASIRLIAVNPAYTRWGDEHWRKPYQDVTRHEAAATVIGRRAQGHKARRRGGASRVQPVDCTADAAELAGPSSRQANTNTGGRPRSGMRGTKSRLPSRHRTRPPGRATVIPASPPRLPNNGEPRL